MPQERAENRPRYTSARVLGLFALGVLTVTLMTAIKHRGREVLETTLAPTGVGDSHFYELERPVIWNRAAARLNGRALFLQGEASEERSDLLMEKVAWFREYHVYKAKEVGDEPVAYFLKTDKGRYLPIGLKKRSVSE